MPNDAAVADIRSVRLFTCIAVTLSLCWGIAPQVCAQSGGPYRMTTFTIDGGGATFSSGGNYRIGGTIGQPDAGPATGGAFRLDGGFWGGAAQLAQPTASTTETPPLTTRTSTPVSTATITSTGVAMHTPTVTPSFTPTATARPEPTATQLSAPTATRTRTATRTPSATPSPTATPAPCVGDCDGAGEVRVEEIVIGVTIALGGLEVDACAVFDADADGQVTVDEILAAVNDALRGCI